MIDPRPAVLMGSQRRKFGERLLYVLVAGGLTLWIACRFYASMRLQTAYTAGPYRFAAEWSAPLDDVFIHFDFARSIARGHPFQWSEGNGYSSGGTSMLYPFVLAPGWLLGLRGGALVVWAGVVACVSTLGLLLASRRMFRELPAWTSYLAPPAVLCIGVLAWSLFSGMEVALFLGLWGGALVAWDDLVRGTPDAGRPPERPYRWALLLGAWNAALAATRPESAVVVAVLAIAGAFAWARRSGVKTGLGVLLATALPGALVILLQTLANRFFTGDSTAAGALVKLELHHPHLDATAVWDAWKFHLEYQVLRVTHYHLSDALPFGWIPWVFAGLALIFSSTRRYALVLWASAICWVMVVALNGQVRWQNERYTMPALAWLMLAASLGAGAVVVHAWQRRQRRAWLRAASLALVIGGVGFFGEHHLPRFRDQVWFFGRASRNIRDQHVFAGRLIRNEVSPQPRRVLVGDAGAIPYAADLPALDIIGLGGYRKLPFARATRLGVAGAIELVERMPEHERPELLALYPSWWGVFPMWFGQVIGEVPVTGNVICGGRSKVLYRSRWEALEHSASPHGLAKTEVVVDELDVADLVSEKQHGYAVSSGQTHLEMKLLPSPLDPWKDLWDAGRIVPAGASETFRLGGLRPGRPTRLVLRLAPTKAGTIDVHVDGTLAGSVSFASVDGWIEPAVLLPPARVQSVLDVRLESKSGERVVHHVWAIQER